MENVKLFAKIERELETLRQRVKIHSQDKGMGFGVFVMKNGRRETMEGTKLPIKKALEHSERKKITSTWEYWKRTPSNKQRWKKKK